MKKSKRKAKFIVPIIIFFFMIVAFVFYLNFKLNKEIDLSLIKTGGSSITKIFYFDYEDRQNRVGQAVELENEALFL